MNSNHNKVVIVTGAARGIGLTASKLFLKNNYKVAMVDRDVKELKKIKIDGSNHKIFDFDISNVKTNNTMIKKIYQWGKRIDVLINNAGVADFGKIEKVSYKKWRTIMETNLDGSFLTTQNCIEFLKKTKGSVINIASISGLRASTLRVAYGTSKAAIVHLTQQQASELGEFGIRVNCVSPGPVKTKLAMAVHTKDIIDAYHDAIPLNRYGTELEIANAIFFLSSEKASYITGQNLSVDGGFEATGVGLPSLRKQ